MPHLRYLEFKPGANLPGEFPFTLPARTNVVESRAFSERLEAAIARYHANAITTAEVLQELIRLAQDIRAARSRGEEQGLSDEEIAF